MPTDFQYDNADNLFITERGTIGEVSEKANAQQQPPLRVLNAVDDVPSEPATRSEIAALEEQIRSALQDSNYVDAVVSVTVVAIEDGEVRIDVETTTDSSQMALS